MKKILLMIFVATLATNMAFSQKVTSKSQSIQITKTKEPPSPRFFSIKAGGGVITEGNNGMYDIELGFTKFFKSQPEGFFWGAQLGSDICKIEGRRSDWESEWESKPTLYIGPSLGYAHILKDNITFSLNLSPNLMHVFCSEEANDSQWGWLIKLQPGVWVKRFYFGLEVLFQTSGTNQAGLGAQIGYRF